MGTTGISLATIEPLTGSNFKKWRADIEIYLGLLNIDFCLIEDEPVITDDTPDQVRAHAAEWTRANRMTKLILKRTMSDTVRGSVSEEGTAREYLENIAEKFTESAKGETSVLLDSFIAMKYNGTSGVREHIMKMIDITTKLKDLKIDVDAQFLVHMALNSLPVSFSQLKTTYNAQKDKWTLNELISICVQEEERMKKEEVVVNLVNKPQPKHHKPKGKKNGSSSSAAAKNPTLAPKPNNLKAKKNTSFKCFFCKREGHMKRECTKYKDWVKKRGNYMTFPIEINLVNVSPNTWWLDTGSPVHITNSLQGFLRRRDPRKSEQRLCVGTGQRVTVKAVGVIKLDLGSGVFYDLNDVYYVPSMKRNLVSVSILIQTGCSFLMNFDGIKISLPSNSIASGVYVDGYMKLLCSYPKEKEICLLETIEPLIGVKRKFSENSFSLWHKRLGHISVERLKILEKQSLLPSLDYTDVGTCIECVKGKMTNTRKKGSTRSSNLLELIHTDISGPFRCPTICGNRYFITFIDDYSRYCHVYLIKEKSQSLEKFIIFRTEVEKQLGKEIKVVRSDRGGEYYGKFDESGQNKGPFALYLQEHGIAAQYTTPGTPEQNGVAERRNRTFLNMVRSMMCASGLPTFLWGEALLTANYLTNRTPSKSVSSTPFELWCGRKPSFYHLHVWGCKAEAKPYNPQLGKLDSKTVSAFFIGYPERSKGFKFYCPSYTSRIIETNKAVFYMNCLLQSPLKMWNLNLKPFQKLKFLKNLNLMLYWILY